MSPQIIDISFLTRDEIKDIKTKVLLLRDHWVPLNPKQKKTFDSIVVRMMPTGMYTSSFSKEEVKINNRLMLDNFSVYYNKIKEKLSSYYNIPVDYSHEFQLPGFHIFVTDDVKNVSYPYLNFHTDEFLKHFSYHNIDSFVIPISLPLSGGSLLFNNPSEIFPYKEGMMAIWPGDLIHSIEPFTFTDSTECRITMQMHVAFGKLPRPAKKGIIFW
jgi:hypothetical protein